MAVERPPTRPGTEPVQRSLGRGVLWGMAVVLAAVVAHALAVAVSGGNVEQALGGLPLVVVPMVIIGTLIGTLLVAPLRQVVARVPHPAIARVLGALACGAVVVGLWWSPAPEETAVVPYDAPNEVVELMLVFTLVSAAAFGSLGSTAERCERSSK